MCTCVSTSKHLKRISTLSLFYACSFAPPYHALFALLEYFFMQSITRAEPSRAEQMRFSLRPGIWAIVCKQYKYDVIFDGFLFSARVGARANTIVTTFLSCILYYQQPHLLVFILFFTSFTMLLPLLTLLLSSPPIQFLFATPKSFRKCILLPFSLWLNFAFAFRHTHINIPYSFRFGIELIQYNSNTMAKSMKLAHIQTRTRVDT